MHLDALRCKVSLQNLRVRPQTRTGQSCMHNGRTTDERYHCGLSGRDPRTSPRTGENCAHEALGPLGASALVARLCWLRHLIRRNRDAVPRRSDVAQPRRRPLLCCSRLPRQRQAAQRAPSGRRLRRKIGLPQRIVLCEGNGGLAGGLILVCISRGTSGQKQKRTSGGRRRQGLLLPVCLRDRGVLPMPGQTRT